MKPPVASDSELSLIAACLEARVSPPCDPEDFWFDKMRTVAKTMRALETEGITPDLATVSEKVWSVSGGYLKPSDIVHLAEYAGLPENIEYHARNVREAAAARKMLKVAWEFIKQFEEGKGTKKKPQELISEFGSKIMQSGETQEVCRDEDLKNGLKDFFACIDERVANFRAGKDVAGISTGLSMIDRATCGMFGQNLWILAARPSAGKTALSLQIAIENAKQGRRILFVSLDMSAHEIYERMTCYESKINLAKIRSGNLSHHDLKRVGDVVQSLSQLQIIISDAPATEIDIMHKTRRYRPDLLIIDFLTKIKPANKTGNPHSDYGEVCKTIKEIGKSHNIPVILLCQLNRAQEREKRRPILSDLRETGQIEEHADLVLFLHAKGNNNSEPEREIMIAKQRQGELAIMRHFFNGATQSFEAADVTY